MAMSSAAFLRRCFSATRATEPSMRRLFLGLRGVSTETGAPAARESKLGLDIQRTKIICTLGPASSDSEIVNALVRDGMTCARFNFSHATEEELVQRFELVRNARGKHFHNDWSNVPPNLRAVLVDTKGPEVRTGPLPGNAAELQIESGMELLLTFSDVTGDAPWGAGDSSSSDSIGLPRLHVDYENLSAAVEVGGNILLDDGLVALEVISTDVSTKQVRCKALNGGPIKKNKGVNLPGAALDLPALTSKDKRDLKWAVGAGADYVAASFIRNADHVRVCRAFLDRLCDEWHALALRTDENAPRPRRPLLISKIESQEGVENFAEILEESDGIMVARGDLGVEIPFEKVFAAQKMMVAACNAAGKPVVVATQMLDSMIRQPRPTRAEVTDVGTAVLDGADVVMLSGETANGKYPIKALRAMVSVVQEADALVDDEAINTMAEVQYQRHKADPAFRAATAKLGDVELDAVSEAAVNAACSLKAKMIVCVTTTGDVARGLARHRPNVPVLAFCFDAAVARQLQLHRAIHPVLLTRAEDHTPLSIVDSANVRMGLLRTEAIRVGREMRWINTGDRIVCVDRARKQAMHGSLAVGSNMKVMTVRDLE